MSVLLLLACAGAPKPEGDGDAIETADSEDSPPTESATDSVPTDPTGTATETCGPEPIPATDPQCPEGTAAHISRVAYATVDAAIAAATAGVTIEVCPGRWPTNARITTPLTLRGAAGRDATVLDGGQRDRVLTIDLLDEAESDSVTIEDLTLACGEASLSGGGIGVGSEDRGAALTVRQSRLVDNKAEEHGGAIDGWPMVSLTLGPEVLIDGNTAAQDGGGVAGSWADVFEDVEFSGNTAGEDGGGYVADNYGPVNLRDVLFRGNTALEGGGAWLDCGDRSNGYASFRDVSFQDNVASGSGGGLFVIETERYPACATIDGGTFSGNVADVGGGLGTSDGDEYAPSIWGSTFDGNTARLGGAIFGRVVGFDGATLVGNLATEAGGAVYATRYASGVGATFEGNTAPVGGAIALDGAELYVVASLGDGDADNVPDDIALLEGGVAYGGYGADTIALCIDPDGCRSAPQGGVADTGNDDTGGDTGADDTAVGADGCGGETAAVVEGAAYRTISVAVAATPEGGIIDVCPGDWPANLHLAWDITLRGAGASATSLDGAGAGSVIIVDDGAHVVIEALTLHGGAAEYGGGLYIAGTVDAVDVVVEENFANAGGGGVWMENADTVWTGGEFRANIAGYGGGLWLDGGTAVFRGTTFRENHALRGGGAYVYDADSTLDGLRFEGNVASTGAGGGLWAHSAGEPILATGVTVVGNYAYESGGGIECGTCWLTDVMASWNSAELGGGLSLTSGWLLGSTVSGNAAIEGGGVYLSEVRVEETNIAGNSAVLGGGVSSDGATLVGVTLSDNRAVDGGAIYSSDETVVEGCTLTGNAADRGGGVWLEDGVFASTLSDWSGNAPDDIAAVGLSETYGDDASFSCDASTATCR